MCVDKSIYCFLITAFKYIVNTSDNAVCFPVQWLSFTVYLRFHEFTLKAFSLSRSCLNFLLIIFSPFLFFKHSLNFWLLLIWMNPLYFARVLSLMWAESCVVLGSWYWVEPHETFFFKLWLKKKKKEVYLLSFAFFFLRLLLFFFFISSQQEMLIPLVDRAVIQCHQYWAVSLFCQLCYRCSAFLNAWKFNYMSRCSI